MLLIIAGTLGTGFAFGRSAVEWPWVVAAGLAVAALTLWRSRRHLKVAAGQSWGRTQGAGPFFSASLIYAALVVMALGVLGLGYLGGALLQ